MLEPWGLQKHGIFIKKVINIKLFAIFPLDIAWGKGNHSKTLQISPQSAPKATPEEPSSAQERPRRAPRASRNHPQRALRGALGVQQVSWGGCGNPGPVLPNFSYFSRASLLSSLLSSVYLFPYMLLCSSSLLSSLCSRLSSLFALLIGLSSGAAAFATGSAAPCLAGEQSV